MLKSLFKSSDFVTILVSVAIGGAVGLGAYTFLYAKGSSYLTNNPAACANCHIMNEQYDGWVKSSHRSVAGCNDCHTPHSLIPKYMTKASNGFWHSFRFTTGRFHEPIQINDRNRKVTEGACRSCHEEIVQAIEGADQSMGKISCISCHSTVGHL
ncbi:cytochrome c nitrite reductase small subunit [bacterium]|nr:cytochrome c nitrite reductase small subunit [bacterium]